MAIEVISEIKKAEEAARVLIKEAQVEVREMNSKANQEGDGKYKSIIDEAKNKGEKIIKEKVDLGNKEAESLFKKGQADCTEIKSVSAEKINSAVKLVIERIVNIHGNS